jgi:ATP-dependent RNA helicase DDX55/SPB4
MATDLAARGIDIPSIDWIVQFDPPQNPDFFVHRVGRTARAGRSGKTLLFLLEHEESFIEFLQLRGVQLEPAGIDVENQEECYERIKSCQYEDREVYEYAKKAFVSYIRYYKEQHLKYIFNFKHLDIGYLAHSFSLLRIPRVQEILGKEITNFTQSEIDPDTITYKEKHKEKQRQAELEE